MSLRPQRVVAVVLIAAAALAMLNAVIARAGAAVGPLLGGAGLVVPALASGAALVLRGRHARPWTALLFVATAILGALYVLAYVLILSDYRDADGFMDCWPSCTALQVAVAVVLWYGGIALVLGALGALVGLLAVELRRPRGRHSFGPWREIDRRAER